MTDGLDALPTMCKTLHCKQGGIIMTDDFTRHPSPVQGVVRLDAPESGNVVYAPSLRSFGAWLHASNDALKAGNSTARRHDLDATVRNEMSGVRSHAFPPEELERLGSLSVGDLCDELATISPTWDDNMTQAMQDALKQARRDINEAVRIWTDKPGHMSIDRLFSGRQDWMSRRRRVRKPTRVISLAVPITANWSINADVLRIMGIASTIAADILSKRGFNVEIMAYEAGTASHSNAARHSLQIVRLKGAKDLLRPAEVVNGMSSWAFRSLWFSGICALDPETVNSGLGSARTLSDEQVDEMKRIMGVDDVVVMRLVPRSNNIPKAIKQAVEVVKEALKEYLG